MNKNTTEPPPISIFPAKRTYIDYPWLVWAIGWLAVYKGLIWITTDPLAPDPVLKITGIKYLLFMIPYTVMGIGIWNLRKWAMQGVLILAAVELLFFILYSQSLSTLAIDKTNLFIHIFTAAIMIINGPISVFIILIAGIGLMKYAGKYELLDEQQE